MKNTSALRMHPQVHSSMHRAGISRGDYSDVYYIDISSGLSISSNRTHGSIDNARQTAREGNLNRGVHRLWGYLYSMSHFSMPHYATPSILSLSFHRANVSYMTRTRNGH